VCEAAEQVLSDYVGSLAEGEMVQDHAKAWLEKKTIFGLGMRQYVMCFSSFHILKSPSLEAK
jgi:hypothetical protein